MTEIRALVAIACGALALALPLPALAADIDTAELARLEADLADAEAVRAIKRLQYSWTHYAEAGDWAAIAALFTEDGRAVAPPADVRGPAAIEAWLRDAMGGGEATLAPDRLNIHLLFSPVINVAADGRSARGRWREVAMTGVYGESAIWSGGIYENEYVKGDDGVWRIAVSHYYPRLEGPYEGGWRNATDPAPLVPFHYDPDAAGRPTIPHASGEASGAEAVPAEVRLVLASRRIEAMLATSAALNLHAAYGYYTDRKMWDDAADLFTDDGVLELCGVGAYRTSASIRAMLGPTGLREGELNDHVQLTPVTTVSPDGRSASLRAFELTVTGEHGKRALWGVNVVEASYVNDGDAWRIARLRVTPRMRMDYAEGWAKGPPAPQSPAPTPDGPVEGCAAAYPARGPAVIDFPHPTSVATPPSLAIETSLVADDLAELRRKLSRAQAYDGAENVSNAYGYYIDEFLWRDTGALFSVDGWKELSYIGTYIGRDRVTQSMIARYGEGGRRAGSMTLHGKTQPYVTVSDDGRSAQIRTRLFQFNTQKETEGSYMMGTYENQVVLEDGVWKIAGMDLDYIWTASYSAGFAGVDAASTRRFAPSQEVIDRYPPDAPLRGSVFPPFPEIAPMAFHYKNPVSGREPQLLLPWSDGRER